MYNSLLFCERLIFLELKTNSATPIRSAKYDPLEYVRYKLKREIIVNALLNLLESK